MAIDFKELKFLRVDPACPSCKQLPYSLLIEGAVLSYWAMVQGKNGSRMVGL